MSSSGVKGLICHYSNSYRGLRQCLCWSPVFALCLFI